MNENTFFKLLKKYLTVIKYILSSSLATIIDNLSFILLMPYISNIWVLTYIGRFFAVIINFTINKKVVFKSGANVLPCFFKYVGLVIVSGGVSAYFVSVICSGIGQTSALVKMGVELGLFFINYFVQKKFIFNGGNTASGTGYKESASTDWTEYYLKPKSKFSTITQKFTLKKILFFIDKYMKYPAHVVELGGGNSCFARDIIKKSKVPINSYSIIDNCDIAIKKFQDMQLKGQAYKLDLTCENVEHQVDKKYDFVYSIGVIEHFNKEDMEQVIKAHFNLCSKDGIVLISVPTPTLQYRFWRRCMELVHKWYFPDELPLKFEDIRECIEKYGMIQEKVINYRLPLTQLIVVAVNKMQ